MYTGDIVRTITPGRLRQDIEATRAAVDALAADIAAESTRLPERWRVGWTRFVMRWGAFVADHPEGFLSDAAASFLHVSYSRLLDLGAELRQWRASFEQLGGRPTTPDATPAPPELPDASALGAGFGLGGALAFAAVLLLWSRK